MFAKFFKRRLISCLCFALAAAFTVSSLPVVALETDVSSPSGEEQVGAMETGDTSLPKEGQFDSSESGDASMPDEEENTDSSGSDDVLLPNEEEQGGSDGSDDFLLPEGEESFGIMASDYALFASEEEQNWALTKPYEVNTPTWHDYKDPDGTKLTDGVYAESYSNILVGMKDNPQATVTVDLEKERKISRLVVSAFEKESYGIKLPVLTKFEYYDASADSWNMIGQSENDLHFPGSQGTFRIEQETDCTTSKVRFTFSGNGPGWIFLDEVEVYGPVGADIPAIPEFEKDLPDEKLAVLGSEAVLSMTLKDSVGLGTLTYEWYKDGEKIEGVNSADYHIANATEADAGDYYVIVTNSKGDLSETVTSKTCHLVVDTVSEHNILFGIPFTTTMQYGDPNSGMGNYTNRTSIPSSYLLTDGLKNNEDNKITGTRVVHFCKNVGSLMFADFTYDLGAVKQFEQLNLSTLAGSAGIGSPRRLQVFTSNDTGVDKKWKLIHDVTLTEETDKDQNRNFIFATQDGAKISGRYIKLNIFFGGLTFIALDEIELLDKTDGQTPDGFFQTSGYTPADKDNIVSWQRPYTTNKKAEDDPDNEVLTDGKIGSADTSDWATYPASSGNLEAVIDLEAPLAFQQVDVGFLNDPNTAPKCPQWAKIEYSSDGQNWALLEQKSLDALSDEEAEVARVQFVAPRTLNARYVKLTVPNSTTVAIDEIMVLKDKTVIETTPEPEITPDPNDLAYGKSYTTAWPSNAGYADSGNKLTDGKRAPLAYGAPDWVGFHLNDGKKEGLDDFYVTVDLGSVQSFEQVKVGSLREKKPGINAPVSMKVEYSSDEKSWKTLAEKELNYADKDAVNRFVCTASEAVSARYVRIHVGINVNWAFLDEIEVLQKADPNPDANENPDYGVERNLLRGNQKYTISRKANINSLAGLLTDGNYGVTYTKYDPNWMGFLPAAEASQNHVTMNFDLLASESVSQIIVSTRRDSANKQTIPQNLTIYASNNNQDWIVMKEFGNALPTDGTSVEMAWDGSVDAQSNPNLSGEMAYIRYIRVEFDVPQGDNYVYLDEVKVLGKLGQCSDANAPYIFDEFGARNLAETSTYWLYPEGQDNSYSDPNMIKLTDGVRGSTSFSDGNWVAFNRSDCTDSADFSRTHHPMRSVIMDLKGQKTIRSITYGICVNKGAGIPSPSSMNIYVSADGEKWLQLTKNTSVSSAVDNGAYTYGWHNTEISENGAVIADMLPEYEMVTARYVRVDLDAVPWVFIDEISVRGYDGKKDGALDVSTRATADIDGAYKQADDSTGDIQDMILCYNGWYGYDAEGDEYNGNMTPFKLRPLLTYVDQNNKAVDTMFDSVLLLGLKSQYGGNFANGNELKAVAKDWIWYMDKTFAPDGDVASLNEAAMTAAQELGDPNYKVNLVVMYPTAYDGVQSNFGSLDGKKNLTFATEDDYDYALQWWLEEALARFDAGNYPYVNFKGFYYLHEGIESGSKEEQRALNFIDAVHDRGLKAYWIPYWNAPGISNATNLGFDGVTLQANHFFDTHYSPYTKGTMCEPTDWGNPLMETHSNWIKYYNIGPELEMDGSAYRQAIKYNIWLDYLNAAVEYGYDGPGYYRNWYYGAPMTTAAYSGNATVRTIYEYAYQMMKGTYTPKEYVDADDFPSDPDYGGLFRGVTGDVANGGSSGSSGGGGSSSGGSSTTPSKPETPSTGEYTWEEVDGSYKLKDADGEYVTGWAKVDGKWYYLNADGIRQTGWQKVDSKWYYLKDDGTMATGWLKLGNVWYYLNAGGAMKTGWLQDGGKWYYLKDWGGMANTSWVQVGNTWYYFRGNGQMATGWLQQGNTWYYLKANGAMATGWNWVGNKCYYFAAGGKMAANTTVGGYKLDASGAWVK